MIPPQEMQQPQVDPSGPMPPGLPPGLVESLMAGGGPEAAGPPAPEAGAESGQDGPSILRGLLEQLDAYKGVERDEEDLLLAEKIGTMIQQLLAKQQKESDEMMQGKVSAGALRRLGG